MENVAQGVQAILTVRDLQSHCLTFGHVLLATLVLSLGLAIMKLASHPPRSRHLAGASRVNAGGLEKGGMEGTLYKAVLPPFIPKDALSRCSDEILDGQLPMECPWTLADGNAYLPTGFKVAEIRALGDFPSYANLSGVPLPKPFEGFDLENTTARPYRPVRWPYNQTMAFQKLEPDWWLEVEKNYCSRIRQRQELFSQYGKAVLDYLQGSELACKETMEMALQFLCSRYPNHFELDHDNAIFRNRLLDTTTYLRLVHPLHVLLNNVPEDFAITLRNHETGAYYLRAGVICSSLGWSLGVKLGMSLDDIHIPVPDYEEKMKFSMNRYFAKMPTDKAIQRGSWGIEIDQPLHIAPGDTAVEPHRAQDPTVPLQRYHLRVDWQTLRRLPLSGAILFNYKALFTPVAELRKEAYIPSLFLQNYKHGKPNLMKHKNIWHTEAAVIPALEQYIKDQETERLIDKNWEPQTLAEWPFYPGWKA